MNDHYYSSDPKSEHDPRTWRTGIKGRPFTFTTDSSVFAKRGLDYGTRLLIEALPLPLRGTVLDMGCGYGPIGLAIKAFSPQAMVTLSDVNRRALDLCRKNAAKNGLASVEIVESDGLAALHGRSFDWIVTNPPVRAGKKVVYRLFEETAAHLSGDGEFWLVMRKKQGAPSALKKLATLFTGVTVVTRGKGYTVIRCGK